MGDFRRPEDLNRQSAEASEQKEATQNLLNDIFKVPDAKKESEEQTPVAQNTDRAGEKRMEEMSPQEHLAAITTALENALKLYNRLPTEWKDAVQTANYESGSINPSDLANPASIRTFLSNLTDRIS